MNHRSFLSILLAFVAVVLINFGSVAEAKTIKAPSYTAEQLEQIQSYAADVAALRDRLPELAKLIQAQDWTFTRNFIHGPFGEIRTTMFRLTQSLPPGPKTEATAIAKKVFDNLVSIDEAAAKKDYKKAIRNYAETMRDLDTFLQLIPSA